MQIDAPIAGATVTGTVAIGGWAIDDVSAVGTGIDPASIAVSVDGGLAGGYATYGGARPDVCAAYPGRVGCPNVGWNFLLDTSLLAPGKHTITVNAANLDPLPARGTESVVVTK